MNCPSCAAAGIDHDLIVERCKSSPLWTGVYLCGLDWLNNDFHHAMNMWFMKKYNSGSRRFVIMIHRACLKTSYFGIAFPTWRAITDPESRTLYMMASSNNARKTLESVTRIFETGENIAHFFPDRVLNPRDPRCKSRVDHLSLPRVGNFREGTLEAYGAETRIVGGHFTTHIFDDMIDETFVDSEPSQRKAVNFIKRSNPLFVNPSEDLRIIVGTRWPGEYYNWLLDPNDNIYKTHEVLLLGCFVDQRYRDFLKKLARSQPWMTATRSGPEIMNLVVGLQLKL